MFRIFGVLILSCLAAIASDTTPADAVKITLERTGCMGDCPSYKLAIHANGSVLYEGRYYVHAKGIRKGRMSASAVQQLAQRLSDGGFFDLPDRLGVCDDTPGVAISLSLNGRSKQIRSGCGERPDLRKLSTEIDRASGSNRWVRGRVRTLFHWPWWRL